MGRWIQPTGGPTLGFYPEPQSAFCWNRSGNTLTVGKTYRLDTFSTAQAESTSDHPGVSGSAWANIVAVASATDNLSAVYILPLTAAADNAKVECVIFGVVQAPVAGGAAGTRGAAVYTDADGDLSVTAPTGGVDGRQVGFLIKGATDATCYVMFSGAPPMAFAITT